MLIARREAEVAVEDQSGDGNRAENVAVPQRS
jgi:hypothetical protein